MAINRFEALDRHELPLQASFERNGATRVFVPVHMQVKGLRPEYRQDRSLLKGAFQDVSRAYNDDAEEQIELIKQHRGAAAVAEVKGYERFNPDWSLLSQRGDKGYLDLIFRHNATVSRLTYNEPFVLMNMRGANGEFYDLTSCATDPIGLAERFETNPEFVLFSPDKMAQYGIAPHGELIDPQTGLLRVTGSGFESEYVPGAKGIAVGFALRAFGVFYVNRLLEARAKTFN